MAKAVSLTEGTVRGIWNIKGIFSREENRWTGSRIAAHQAAMLHKKGQKQEKLHVEKREQFRGRIEKTENYSETCIRRNLNKAEICSM
jgi:hypothetical protein